MRRTEKNKNPVELLADYTLNKMTGLVKESSERERQAASSNIQEALEALQEGVWYTTTYKKYRLDLGKKISPAQLPELAKTHFPQKVGDGYAPSDYFERVDHVVWRVKTSVSASNALDAALQGPTLMDCGGVCNLARHFALREVMGKEDFDRVFQGRLIIGYPPVDYIDIFMQKVNKITKGCLVSFPNNKNYTRKHPFGLAQGLNTVADGTDCFKAIGLPVEGVSSKQISQYLLNEFNLPINRRLDVVVSQKEFDETYGRYEDQLYSEDAQITLEQIPRDLRVFNFNPEAIITFLSAGRQKEKVISLLKEDWKQVDRFFEKKTEQKS